MTDTTETVATINDIVTFMQTGKPAPTSKDFHTQLGVHFEEVHEMLTALSPVTQQARMLLELVSGACLAFSTYLKENDNQVTISNRLEFLDGLCDQIVTATGVGYVAGMDMVGASNEVNRSNLSKFDENGQPILDENGKIMKGPNYSKPELNPFI